MIKIGSFPVINFIKKIDTAINLMRLPLKDISFDDFRFST